MSIKQNITSLQNLLEQVNTLPEEVILPELSNPADASKALSGYEFINKDCEKVTGTIPTKTASNLTASGATVTVPAGYYANQATKSVATATQATPSITINTSGLITAIATQTAGYVSAGTKSSTHQLAFQPAKTITPSTASQIAVSSGYYTGGNVMVAGDSNLVAGNIKSGVSIFGVSGNYEGSGGDTSIEDALVTRTLTSYANSRVTTIGNYAFYSCSRLTTVVFPVATTIGNSAFYNCSNLITVSFPVATTIGNYAFYSCSRLTTVVFPVATTIGSSAFHSCSKLTTVSFSVATTICSSAFYKCYKLKSLYLRGSSLCKLSNSNAFTSTPIGGYSASAGTYGSIYVPASLLTSYQTATNWTYFSSRFVGI